MRIIVEETETELDLPEKDVPLKQVIEEVEDFLFGVGKIPIALTINGQQLTQEELITREEEILSGEETLEFGVMTFFEFLRINLEGASAANEELLKSIKTFAAEIHEKTKTTDTQNLVEELNHFFDFWYRLYRLLPEQFEKLDFSGKNFEQCFEDLRVLFEEVVAAMEDQDFVLAADLLIYEVVPILEMIDNNIPTLQEQLGTVEVHE